jgi:hypothetical protein
MKQAAAAIMAAGALSCSWSQPALSPINHNQTGSKAVKH